MEIKSPRSSRLVYTQAKFLSWMLRAYSIGASTRLTADDLEVRASIEQCIPLIEHSAAPDYFLYRFGFCYVHFGRRGDSVVIFHLGRWEDMLEVFANRFYRNISQDTFEPLATSDPLCCWHDAPLIGHEFNNIASLRDWSDFDRLRTAYFALEALPLSARPRVC